MHISKDIAQHARGHAYMYVRCVRELSLATTRGLLTQIPWGTGPVEQVGFCFPSDSFCVIGIPTNTDSAQFGVAPAHSAFHG